MKKKLRLHERFTFLIIRNADQSVKQFRISKLILWAIPSIAIVSIASLITSIYFLSTYKAELTDQISELEYIVQDKNGDIQDREHSITNLQNEILDLSLQAEDMQSRLEKIAELEAELELIISTFNDKGQTSSIQSMSESILALDDSYDVMHMGGEYIPLNEDMALSLADQTRSTLSQIGDDLSILDANISTAMSEIEEIQFKLDKNPTLWPIDSTRVTSKFGYRKDPITRRSAYHNGVDFGASKGDPVYAAGAGKVVETGRTKAGGKFVTISHGNGLKTTYKHLSSILVNENDEVYKGDTIGKAGSTGRSTGVHLHFEVLKNGKPVDPFLYISKDKQ